MRVQTITALNQLNRDFYQQISRDFSESRNFSWQGWHKLLKFLPRKKQLRILDLGCGNGRLVEFLGKELKQNFSYLGLDNSTALLKIAQQQFSQQKFIFCDLVENYLQEQETFNLGKEKFDLIVAFGLTHHLPSQRLRQKFLQNLKKHLAPNGLIVLTVWQFAQEKQRFQKNILNVQKISKNRKIKLCRKLQLIKLLLQLERNDYLLDWRRGSKAGQYFRYCHFISENEMAQLARQAGLQVSNSFFADGKSKQLNQYFLLRIN